ncbi:MAG: hypothetical protein IT347_07695 [Candidatus Eisenbacteria bacterium]|nr:hypothetical protein [Candidatus Eisenbacteria bacterium]
MTRFLTPRVLLALALAALALPFALAGCARKITSVDAAYTQLEGTPDPEAQLMVWPDMPTYVYYYLDRGTAGPSESDSLVSTESVYRNGPGAVQTMLLDGGNGSGFEFFRRASNGGFEPMRDYIVNAPRKWLDSHWELYELTDSRPSGFSPATYMARGLLAGATTTRSPLTNPARLTGATTSSLVYTGQAFPAKADSNFTMSWGAIAGAAGYWLHVYQFRPSALNAEYVLSGTPRPVWNGLVRDQFVGYVAAPATSYKLGSPTGARVLTYSPPISGQVYLVRVTAVDADGQVIAWIGSDFSGLRVDAEGHVQGVFGGSFMVSQEEGRWKIFPLGANAVNPGGVATGPNMIRMPDGSTLYTGSDARR